MYSEIRRVREDAYQDVRLGGSPETYHNLRSVEWAFLALAAPHEPQLMNRYDIPYIVKDYNAMQQEAQEHGTVLRGVEVSPDLIPHLSWMLQHSHIPSDLGAGAFCVPLYQLRLSRV
jgi:hypothetical protein